MFNFDIISAYFEQVANTELQLSVIVTYTIIMLVIYIARLFVVYRAKKVQHDLRRDRWGFTIGHIVMQFIISYIVGWSVILLTFNNDINIFINYVIAPFIGFLAGIYIDNKFLLPLDTVYNSKKSSSGKTSSSGDVNNITVNVNNSQPNETNKDKDFILGNIEPLDESIIYSDKFETVMIDTINTIIQSQNAQCEELASQSEKIKRNSSILDALRNNEMINKKIELKKMIYECLNNGYATPEENDKITQYYIAYTELGGNHEIKTLYEQHYLKLPVHISGKGNMQDSPNYNIYLDKRDQKIYTYGELDNRDSDIVE